MIHTGVHEWLPDLSKPDSLFLNSSYRLLTFCFQARLVFREHHECVLQLTSIVRGWLSVLHSLCRLQELPDARTCTFNLHLLACQLLVQCLMRGITWELFELWVERLIGENKQRVKLRTRAEPEKTMMGDDMQKRALQKWRLQWPAVFSWQEHSGKHKQSQRPSCCSTTGELLGTGQTAAGVKLDGQHAWDSAVQQRARRAVESNFEQGDLRAFWLDNWGQLRATVFKEALLPGGMYASSTAYTRSRTRDGSFVLVPYIGPRDGDVKPYAARVRYYVELSLPTGVQPRGDAAGPAAAAAAASPLRFAVCDLVKYVQPYEDPDICGHDSMILFGRDQGTRERTYESCDYPVLLSKIHAPLFRQEYQGEDGSTCWAFVPLMFRTGGWKQRTRL